MSLAGSSIITQLLGKFAIFLKPRPNLIFIENIRVVAWCICNLKLPLPQPQVRSLFGPFSSLSKHENNKTFPVLDWVVEVYLSAICLLRALGYLYSLIWASSYFLFFFLFPYSLFIHMNAFIPNIPKIKRQYSCIEKTLPFPLYFFKFCHEQMLFYLQANWNNSSKKCELYYSSQHSVNSGLNYT